MRGPFQVQSKKTLIVMFAFVEWKDLIGDEVDLNCWMREDLKVELTDGVEREFRRQFIVEEVGWCVRGTAGPLRQPKQMPKYARHRDNCCIHF